MKILTMAGVAAGLCLSSMQLHADAMGRDMGFDGEPTQAGAKTQSMRSAAPPSSGYVGLSETLPENPQCASGGQACAEKPQSANDKDKATPAQ
ncbi:MAG: hypothetical protein PSX71_03615 [bacterium]|nr:hypothetical protein [bacterium]